MGDYIEIEDQEKDIRLERGSYFKRVVISIPLPLYKAPSLLFFLSLTLKIEITFLGIGKESCSLLYPFQKEI